MVQQLARAVLVIAAIGLAACGKPNTSPSSPSVSTSTPVVPSVADPSVPLATSVVSPTTNATAQDAASGRPTGTMTKAQESSAMPMPGQVNNHSTTSLDPVKRGASAP